jgi:Arc/MetJ family transcription regulator
MRTTITFDDDVAAAVERIRRERSIGVSEAVNELVRAGLSTSKKKRGEFRQTTWPLGLKIDVTNVAEALEQLEGPDFR